MNIEVQRLTELLHDLPAQWIVIGIAGSTTTVVLLICLLRKLCTSSANGLKKKKRSKKSPTSKNTRKLPENSPPSTDSNCDVTQLTPTVSSTDVNRKRAKPAASKSPEISSPQPNDNEVSLKTIPDVGKSKKSKKENKSKSVESKKTKAQSTDKMTPIHASQTETDTGETRSRDNDDGGDWQEVRFVRRNRKHHTE